MACAGRAGCGADEGAAKLFAGRKDFKSFATTREYEMETTVRRVTKCEVRKRGRTGRVIAGEGFLQDVPGIVGTLVQVGRKLTKGHSPNFSRPRSSRRRHERPACGLTLVKVVYKEG